MDDAESKDKKIKMLEYQIRVLTETIHIYAGELTKIWNKNKDHQ